MNRHNNKLAMTQLQTQKQTTQNLQTNGQVIAYLLLTTIYAPELVTLDCSFTLVLRGLNTQPYTDGSSR